MPRLSIQLPDGSEKTIVLPKNGEYCARIGRDGKNVTSRVIRDRLMREMRTNISIQVEDTDKAGVFSVSARGAIDVYKRQAPLPSTNIPNG